MGSNMLILERGRVWGIRKKRRIRQSGERDLEKEDVSLNDDS